MRWALLLSICFIMFGYSITRYVLIPLQDQVIHYYGMNDVQYNLLQSIYAWPNSISCFIGGIMMDKIGLHSMIFIAWTTNMIGCSIMTLSASPTMISYIMLSISRIIVGIGNEVMTITLRVYIVDNFKRNKHGIIFGVFLTMISISLGLNNIFIYQIYSLSKSMQFAVSVPLMIYPIVSAPLLLHILWQKRHPNHQKTTKSHTSLITPTTKTRRSIARKQTINFSVHEIKQFPK
eukprot:240678_1